MICIREQACWNHCGASAPNFWNPTDWGQTKEDPFIFQKHTYQGSIEESGCTKGKGDGTCSAFWFRVRVDSGR